jgi:hypothetical protein
MSRNSLLASLRTPVFSSMFTRISIQLAVAAGCLLVLTGAAGYFLGLVAPDPIAFSDGVEFRDFAIGKGLLFHSGRGDGKLDTRVMYSNFFLADHQLTSSDVDNIGMRHDCGLTPAWRGIIWVSHLRGEFATLPETVGGKTRIWGNVLVAGDEDLMDRIEDLWRSK